MNQIRTIAAGLFGAALGAGAWLLCSWLLDFPSAWMAILVGLTTGYAVRLGRRADEPTTAHSIIATLLPLAAIVPVSYWINDQANAIAVREKYAQYWNMLEQNSLNDESMIGTVADEIVLERMAANIPINWPDPEMTYQDALWPHDYPEDIWAEAEERWYGFDEGEQEDRRAAQADRVRQALRVQQRLVQREEYTASIFGWGMVWMGVALAAAWRMSR